MDSRNGKSDKENVVAKISLSAHNYNSHIWSDVKDFTSCVGLEALVWAWSDRLQFLLLKYVSEKM